MKLISNFKELYYSDQLPTELHDWFEIEEIKIVVIFWFISILSTIIIIHLMFKKIYYLCLALSSF